MDELKNIEDVKSLVNVLQSEIFSLKEAFDLAYKNFDNSSVSDKEYFREELTKSQFDLEIKKAELRGLLNCFKTP